MPEPVESLELALEYRFLNRELLERALTHRSRSAEHSRSEVAGDNEQLEFLGDSILGFVASEALFLDFPDAREGDLSQWKAHLVSAAHLYECARKLDLGQFLLLGKGEELNGGRDRKTLLADALEAVIAAIYLDGGMDPARRFVRAKVLGPMENAEDLEAFGQLNFKSLLQETVQSLGLPTPQYTIVSTSGPEHDKVFVIEARVGDRLMSRGTGSSKKKASQAAANRMLEELRASENSSRD